MLIELHTKSQEYNKILINPSHIVVINNHPGGVTVQLTSGAYFLVIESMEYIQDIMNPKVVK